MKYVQSSPIHRTVYTLFHLGQKFNSTMNHEKRIPWILSVILKFALQAKYNNMIIYASAILKTGDEKIMERNP